MKLIRSHHAALDRQRLIGLRRHFRQLCWASVPVLSAGFLTFVPFLYLAAIRRKARYVAVSAAYLTIIILATAIAGNLTAGGKAALALSILIIGAVHVFIAFRPGAAMTSWRDFYLPGRGDADEPPREISDDATAVPAMPPAGISGPLGEPGSRGRPPRVLRVDHVQLYVKYPGLPQWATAESGWLVLTDAGEVRFYERFTPDMSTAPTASAPSVTEFARAVHLFTGVDARFGKTKRWVQFDGGTGLVSRADTAEKEIAGVAGAVGAVTGLVGTIGSAVSLVANVPEMTRYGRDRRHRMRARKAWYPVLMGARPWHMINVADTEARPVATTAPSRPQVTTAASGRSSRRPGNGRAIGIDLGTTTSVLAILQDGKPAVVASAEGSPAIPSVVAFGQHGEVLVGGAAVRQAVANAERTIGSAKRQMGTGWTVTIDDKMFTAQQISAFILQKLKRDAESYLGEIITDAVISVPACFSDAQRKATIAAGQIAGLDVLCLINDPTAAALGHPTNEATILVFDLGGGNLSVSVIGLGGSGVEVKAAGGDTRLGGDEWDQRIADWLVRDFKNGHGVDLSEDAVAVRRLRESAQKAKVELSDSAQTRIFVPSITDAGQGPQHLDVTLSRDEFQQMTSDLLDRCKGPLQQVISDAGVEPGQIGRVVLAGGATRMPAVADLVCALAGNRQPDISSDEVVAAGACLQAGVLKGLVKAVPPRDVTPLSLRIETTGGAFLDLIKRNTIIPVKRSETFTTGDDNQSSLQIQLFQGEQEIAAKNTKVGVFELVGIPPAPRCFPQLQVTFEIDANGLANVSAVDLDTGQRLTVAAGLWTGRPPTGVPPWTAQQHPLQEPRPGSPADLSILDTITRGRPDRVGAARRPSQNVSQSRRVQETASEPLVVQSGRDRAPCRHLRLSRCGPLTRSGCWMPGEDAVSVLLQPVHILGDFALGLFDLSLGDTGDGDISFQGGQQVGERLFLGLVADRDLVEVHSHQPVVQDDGVGWP